MDLFQAEKKSRLRTKHGWSHLSVPAFSPSAKLFKPESLYLCFQQCPETLCILIFGPEGRNSLARAT